MKNKFLNIMLLYTILWSVLGTPAFAQGWTLFPNLPFHEAPHLIKSVRINRGLLFASSAGDLFISKDAGKSWVRVFRIRGTNAKINDVAVFTANPKAWYALTSQGLYHSSNEGIDWRKIFQAIGPEGSDCLSLAMHPFHSNLLYLGTRRGVYLSKDGGENWVQAFAELARKSVHKIEADRTNGEIFFAAGTELYRYHIGRDQFQKVYADPFSVLEEEAENVSTEEADEIENESQSAIRLLILPARSKFELAIGTSKGVLVSSDEGETWERLSIDGLASSGITDLVYSSTTETFFAATRKGIFQYEPAKKHWKELYEGLPTVKAGRIDLGPGKPESLMAATESGIFYYSVHLPDTNPEIQFAAADAYKMNLLAELHRAEPSVRDIQKHAIHYANVGNGKIERWQAASRLQALVPTLSFSKGLDVDNNIHVDTASTTTPDQFVQGPDDRSRATDVNLSWNLGELLFSSAQTSIDSREKLMVELRDEILSEVTRLYFERKRAQSEFIMNPPAGALERMQALLRLEELTANLDALTNGYLSNRLLNLYSRHPELADLWKIAVEETNLP